MDLARIDAGAADDAVIRGAKRSTRLAKVSVVRQVEELTAKIDLVPTFIPRESLVNGSVEADNAGPDEGVATARAEAEVSDGGGILAEAIDKGAGVEVLCNGLRTTVATDTGEGIGGAPAASTVLDVARSEVNREREPTLEGENAADLPTAEQRIADRILDGVTAAAAEGYFIEERIREAMAEIEGGEAAVPPE